MATGQTKSKLITKILTLAKIKGQARTQRRAQLMEIPMNSLHKIRRDAEAAKGGKPKAQPKKQTQAAGKKRSRKSLPKNLKKRAAKISRAIKDGKIAVKSGKTKPADYQGTSRERYDKFIALYKGVSIRKKGRKAAKKGMKTVYAQITGAKLPYYLSSGYNVGGGKGGPGIIRTIAKSGATPFRKLTLAGQKKVIAFLNGPGKIMRSKGAKKQAAQALITAK